MSTTGASALSAWSNSALFLMCLVNEYDVAAVTRPFNSAPL